MYIAYQDLSKGFDKFIFMKEYGKDFLIIRLLYELLMKIGNN